MTGLNGGIYQITNTRTGSRYIGQSVDLARRRRWHLTALERGTHWNKRLQASWNKHGAQVFMFTVLERCPKNLLDEREQWYLDNFRPEYNIAICAKSPARGVPKSLETRRKMSLAATGRVMDRDAVERSAAKHRGRKQSPEAVAKTAAANRGKKWPEERRRAASERMKALVAENPGILGPMQQARKACAER